jgi:SAM-dependent methyltransferase
LNREQLGRRFARFATDAVVRRPRLWRVLRPLLRFEFEQLAPAWDERRSAQAFAPYEAALERLGEAPRRALDVGTGTGTGALAIARRFPSTEVVGVDLAEAMIGRARDKLSGDLRTRVRFEVADASRLPFGDGSFDLVALANMIPFFDELARVSAPEAAVLLSFSAGAATPIYVPPQTLRAELGRRGFADFAEISAGTGTALLAWKRGAS